MRTVELYKIVKNDLVHVDYGVESKIDSYTAQGYIVLVEFWRGIVVGKSNNITIQLD